MKKKKLFRNCLIAVLISLVASLIPLIISIFDFETNNFSYNNFLVTATINEDGSLSMREEFNLVCSNKHVYSREINYGKDNRANYSPNNQGAFDMNSFKVTVQTKSRTITATKEDNDYAYKGDLFKDVIAFTGEKNDLGEKVTCQDKNAEKVEIYLYDGIKKDTKYILEYKINKALNIFNDVAELNWKLLPSLDAVRENVKVILKYPKNNFKLAETQEEEGIHYYGYGGSNSEFVKEECNNHQIVAVNQRLAISEEIEIRTFFPSSVIKADTGTNVFNKNGKDIILKQINEMQEEQDHYVAVRNVVSYGLYISLGIIIILMVLFYVIVYINYDKELKSDFDNEYYRELPANYPPAELDYLYNEEKISVNALNATLMDLIRRKYIIIDQNDSSLTNKRPNFKLIYQRDKDQSELKTYERYFLYWYFDVIGNKSNEITLDEIDRFVATETNAKRYETCNTQWNNLVLAEGREKSFFDHSVNLKAFKFASLSFVGIILSFFAAFAAANYKLPLLSLFIFISLSLSICFIIYTMQISRRSPEGNEDYVRWKAFENFLKEFSRFEDYPVPGIIVWEHYMVYATVFGIADLVEKQLRTKFKDNTILAREAENSIFFYPSFNHYVCYRVNQSRMIGKQTIMDANARRMATSRSSGGHGGFGGGSSFGGGGGHSSVR